MTRRQEGVGSRRDSFHERRRMPLPRNLDAGRLVDATAADLAAMIAERIDVLGRPRRPFVDPEPQPSRRDWLLVFVALFKLLDLADEQQKPR